jgi:hypothetical protein
MKPTGLFKFTHPDTRESKTSLKYFGSLDEMNKESRVVPFD